MYALDALSRSFWIEPAEKLYREVDTKWNDVFCGYYFRYENWRRIWALDERVLLLHDFRLCGGGFFGGSGFAQVLADKWIVIGEDLRMPAGWSCYCWLLGNRPNTEFDLAKLSAMLDNGKNTIHDSPDRTKVSMPHFIYTVAVSYVPLHDKAMETAEAVGLVEIQNGRKKAETLNASESIRKAMDRNQLGFKRKYVRS